MPPKKATKAKATPAKPAATVTTLRGREIETTAAAGRPHRASVASVGTPAVAKVKKAAPAKKAAPKAKATTTEPAAGKKRGRPAKAAEQDEEEAEVEAEPPKKRGRPAKGDAPKPAAKAAPKKNATPKAKTTAKAKTPAKAAPAVPEGETAPPKRRGRPPKGGETTKVEVADEAAAEQLEGELVETAEAEGPSKRTKSPSKKRGRPIKAKGKAKTAVTEVVDEEEDLDEEDVAEATNEESTKQYWLMKAEQEDRQETLSDGSVFNAKFTIDDLRSKSEPEPWDGVRNPTACKNMKAMKVGDLAFFYASGGKKGREPGITGIIEVVKDAEPDLSAFDENAPYYVKNATQRGTEERPRWFMVFVEFRKKLSKQVTLKELKKYALKDGVLAQMQEFTAARLSVSKVSEAEWNFIVDNLIEGYEEDEGLSASEAGDSKVPNGVKKTIESDAPTADTGLTAITAPTSRPASRAGSRAGSESLANGLKPPSRPASRAASLQPPARSVSRGRSRTPGSRRGTSVQPTQMDIVTEES